MTADYFKGPGQWFSVLARKAEPVTGNGQNHVPVCQFSTFFAFFCLPFFSFFFNSILCISITIYQPKCPLFWLSFQGLLSQQFQKQYLLQIILHPAVLHAARAGGSMKGVGGEQARKSFHSHLLNTSAVPVTLWSVRGSSSSMWPAWETEGSGIPSAAQISCSHHDQLKEKWMMVADQ